MMVKYVLFQFQHIIAFEMEEAVALFAFHMYAIGVAASASGIFIAGAGAFVDNELLYFTACHQIFKLSVDRGLSDGVSHGAEVIVYIGSGKMFTLC